MYIFWSGRSIFITLELENVNVLVALESIFYIAVVWRAARTGKQERPSVILMMCGKL